MQRRIVTSVSLHRLNFQWIILKKARASNLHHDHLCSTGQEPRLGLCMIFYKSHATKTRRSPTSFHKPPRCRSPTPLSNCQHVLKINKLHNCCDVSRTSHPQSAQCRNPTLLNSPPRSFLRYKLFSRSVPS